MSVTGASPTGILVRIEPPEVSPSIDFFEASLKGGTALERCTVRPSAKPLQCKITGLTAGKTPTLEVRSCVPGDNACSSAVEKVALLRMLFYVSCIQKQKTHVSALSRQ